MSKTLTPQQAKIVEKYEAVYPHLSVLAQRARSGDVQACKALGDSMSRLAYPDGISGLDALAIGDIGVAE